MQSMVDADMRLQVQTIQPVFERYDKETKEMIFKASYYAAGEDKADDLAKAARILRINQHVLVVPGTQKGNMAENFALAHIRKSKLYEDRIEFCLAVAENTADALWDDCWESVTRIPWTFKPTRTQVLQRHFLNKLRDGALRQLMTSSPSSAPQQIIRVSPRLDHISDNGRPAGTVRRHGSDPQGRGAGCYGVSAYGCRHPY